jgi:hypothetical protein
LFLVTLIKCLAGSSFSTMMGRLYRAIVPIRNCKSQQKFKVRA